MMFGLSFWGVLKSSWKTIVCLVAAVAFLPLVFVCGTPAAKCGYSIIVMAFLWLLEPIPLAATALLPIFLYPMLGVLSTSEASTPYMKDALALFLGGLMVAVSVEYSNLHRRIALKVLLLLGTSPKWLMLGFMLPTMGLSMWISNTATAAMMVPIATAVIQEVEKEWKRRKSVAPHHMMPPPDFQLTVMNSHDDKIGNGKLPATEEEEKNKDMAEESELDPYHQRLKKTLLLSVAYAANTGGTGTMTGTSSNVVFRGILEELHPLQSDMTFATWMMYNIPGMVLCVLACWFYLLTVFLGGICAKGDKKSEASARRIIQQKYDELGSLTFHEGGVLFFFLLFVFLLVFEDPKFIDGWAVKMDSGVKIKDATPAIGIAVLMFLVPARPRELGKSPGLLTWEVVHEKLPWGVWILLGGGLAMAEGAKKSGLSEWIGLQLIHLAVLPREGVIAIICLMSAAITEVASNSAVAAIFLPIVSQMAVSTKVNPLYYMLPLTVSCSYAFMLPVASASNALVFEAAKMKPIDMAKPGFCMNLICIAIQMLMLNTLGVALFDLNTFPTWATNGTLPITTPFPNVTST